jgi:transcriptional regulator with XRE-family HTH domain
MYGAFIKQARVSRGLTQVELARLVGIEQPNLSAYENDRQMPSADILNRILAGCGYLLEATAGDRRLICPLPGSRPTTGPHLLFGRDVSNQSRDPATKPPRPGDELSAAKLEQVLAIADAFRFSNDRAMRAIGAVILEIDAALKGLGVRHAFGGALALAYYADPRGTVDIDINVGVAFESRMPLLAQLEGIGWQADDEAAQADPAAGTRLHQVGETVVIDLFFAFADIHEMILDQAVFKPFIHAGERHELQFLSVDDLVVFKISLGRSRDWADIEAIRDAGTVIDPDYIEAQLVQLNGPTAYSSAARLRALLRESPV